MQLKYPRTCAVPVCLAIVATRAHLRLDFPGLWAEDGSRFLPDALHRGWASLLEPMAGYYHTLPRVLAIVLVEAFPLRHYPYLITLACLVLFALAAAMFASTDYREYVPADNVRLAACAGICFAPGLSEVLGNTANLHWVCFLFGWMLAMRPARRAVHGAELTAMLLAIGSAGELIVTVPLYLRRCLLRRRQGLPIAPDGVVVLATLAMALANLACKTMQPSGPSVQIWMNLRQLLATAGWVLIRTVVLEPWTTPALRHDLHQLFSDNLCRNVAACGLVFLLWRLWRGNTASRGLVYGLICALALIPLTWLVRPGSIDVYAAFWQHPEWYEFRYAFALAPIVLVLWVTALRTPAFFFVYALGTSPGLLLPHYRLDGWRAFAAETERRAAHCIPGRVAIGIAPLGWNTYYDAQEDQACARHLAH